MEIAFLALHPKGPKMRNAEISKYVKCSFVTVKKWVKRYRETGDVQEEIRGKRKRVTTSKQDKLIIDTIEQHSEESMPKIYERLKRKGITCHMNTVQSRVKQFGI